MIPENLFPKKTGRGEIGSKLSIPPRETAVLQEMWVLRFHEVSIFTFWMMMPGAFETLLSLTK
jgi:hypothetical protein